MDYELIEKLVKSAKSGDKGAFEQLYNLTWRYLYFSTVSRVGDEDAACEIVQEVYLSFHKNIRKLKHEVAFVQWLNQVANHKIADYFRKKKRIRAIEEPADTSGAEIYDIESEFLVEEDFLDKERSRFIYLCIKSLPDKQQSAIYHYYYDELSTADIARIEKVPESVIRKRLFDARKALREKLDDETRRSTRYG